MDHFLQTIFLSLSMILLSRSLHGSFSSTLGSFTSTMSGFGDGVKQFGEGMAESFGMNPPGYNYTFRWLNSANSIAECEAKRIKKYQGMMINRDSIESHTLYPGQIAPESEFNGIGLYLAVILRCGGNDLFTRNIVNLLPQYQQNETTYWYHVYENENGPQAEYVGTEYTTSDHFSGVIYNETSTAQLMTFPYGTQNFTVKLDPNSFNTLLSPAAQAKNMKYRIRPKSGMTTFNFGQNGEKKVPLNSQGLASGTKTNNQWQKVQPVTYHYEITDSGVYTTGFNPGNFTQSNSNMRSITPVECSVWNKSISQVQNASSATGLEYIQLKNHTVWVVYDFGGWISDDHPTMDQPIMAKVEPGTAVQFLFLRPSLSVSARLTEQELIQTQNLKPLDEFNTVNVSALQQGASKAQISQIQSSVAKSQNLYTQITVQAPTIPKASLYIVSLNTTDDQKAQLFLQNLINGNVSIPQGPSLTSVQNLTQDLKSTLFVERLDTSLGVLKDSVTGVSGYLLCSDIFTPFGTTESGPYYYSVEPPQGQIVSLQNLVQPYLSQTFLGQQNNLTLLDSTVQGWLETAYNQSSIALGLQQVRPNIETFLQQNGNSVLFGIKNGNVDTSTFSWLGSELVNMILSGPKGIRQLAFLWSPGENHHVYSDKSNQSATATAPDAPAGWNPTQTFDLSGNPVIS